MTDEYRSTQGLAGLWAMYALMLLIPVAMLLFLQEKGHQYRLDSAPPVTLRSILYFAVIIGFPLINLLRHIMLRLNQTMPGPKPAYKRYFKTVLVSLLLSEIIAGLGVMLYLKGDTFDTLVIYLLLGLLALFLYRPKQVEYEQIIEELKNRQLGS